MKHDMRRNEHTYRTDPFPETAPVGPGRVRPTLKATFGEQVQRLNALRTCGKRDPGGLGCSCIRPEGHREVCIFTPRAP